MSLVPIYLEEARPAPCCTPTPEKPLSALVVLLRLELPALGEAR